MEHLRNRCNYHKIVMRVSMKIILSICSGGGGWDNSSDGRSSGSDIMQRRVGYERQMKREYNARHSTRMNKLNDESAMEVSDCRTISCIFIKFLKYVFNPNYII